MDTFLQDLRYALRALRRSPGFTLAAVLTIALGIGATSTVFGMVDVLFFRPPAGVGEPEAVVRPYITRREGVMRTDGNYSIFSDYTDLRDNTRSLAGLAAYTDIALSVGEGVEAGSAEGMLVSGDYFAVLAVRPALGRFFVPEEDAGPGARPAVVIGHAFWHRHFGGDAAVIGRTIRLDGHDYPVVGVAPAGFHGIEAGAPDLWIPFAQSARVGHAAPYDWLAYTVGRLAPGVTRERAAEELAAILRHAAEAKPDWDQNPEVALGPVQAARAPDLSAQPSRLRTQATLLRWLMLAAALMLAIACSNVANLLLVRAATRRKEIATRLAVGASRARLVRHLLAESALLALAGAGAGVLVALWGTDLLPSLGLPPIRFFAEGRVLVFATAVAALSTLLFGLAPALVSTRADLATSLKEGTQEGVDRRSRLRATLMVVQVALAVLLLTGAGLFVHSLRNVQAIEPGFDVERLIHASVDLRKAGYRGAAATTFYNQALERLRAIPGVTGATLASSPQLGGRMLTMTYEVPDREPAPGGGGEHGRGAADGDDRGAATYIVGSDYFRTIGTPMRHGRDFTAQDRAGGTPVAIVNETFARRAWQGADPLGKCLRFGRERTCHTVVGIAADARYGTLDEPRGAVFFVPAGQIPESRFSFLIRAAGDPAELAGAVRSALADLDPALPYVAVKTMPELLRPQLQPRRLGAALFGAFGLLALLLATVGLHGVLAYAVTQRTRELGIRLALGAVPRELVALVVRQGVVLTVLGLAIGAAAALAAARLVRHLLFGVSATDPATFVGVVLALAGAAMLACWIPARRAARVDPMVALRSE